MFFIQFQILHFKKINNYNSNTASDISLVIPFKVGRLNYNLTVEQELLAKKKKFYMASNSLNFNLVLMTKQRILQKVKKY